MKTINLKAIYRFEGYVVKELMCESGAAQLKLDFDKRSGPRCPRCAGKLPRNKIGKGCAMDLPIADVPCVFIIYPRIQGHCHPCRAYVTTRPAEIHPTKDSTWRLMRTVSSWASAAPASSVAIMFELSEATVRRYDQAVLKEQLPPPDLDNLRCILIDEKHLGRRHGYVTVVLNGDTGELLHMAKGKKKKSLESFVEGLSDTQREMIEVVGIDRAGAYQSIVEQWLPDCAIVYDRFHLVMNVNQAVDEVRRSEWRSAGKSGKKVIKSSRYLLLANPENLNETGIERLRVLREANEAISTAYQLSEQFRAIYLYKQEGWAKRALLAWCDLAQASDLAPFQRLARGFLKQCSRITSYIKHKVTSGRIEGFNSQISKIIQRACGIADLDYLFLRLRHQSVMRI